MQITRDERGQPMIEWQMAPGGWTRAWVQGRTGNPEKDWANTGRYLNVVRIEGPTRRLVATRLIFQFSVTAR